MMPRRVMGGQLRVAVAGLPIRTRNRPQGFYGGRLNADHVALMDHAAGQKPGGPPIASILLLAASIG